MADNVIQILEGFSDTGCVGCGSVSGAALWGLGAQPAQPSKGAIIAVVIIVGAAVLFGRGRRRKGGRGRRGLGAFNPSRTAYGATIPR